MSVLSYTAQRPSTSGSMLTVDRMLKDPKFLAQRVIPANVEFLSDLLFRRDTTTSGAVVYAEAQKDGAYPSRGEAGIIGETGEIPAIDIDGAEDKVAVAQKSGAGYHVSDEARDRNNPSIIAKGNLKLRNAMLRQDAYRCLAAFRASAAANGATINATDVWTTPKAFRTDIVKNVGYIEGLGLAYKPDTVLIHPDTYSDLLLLDELQNLAPRENSALNPLFSRQLSGYLEMNYVKTDLVGRTEAIILQKQMTGVNVVEKDFTMKIARDETRERSFVFGTRRSVPVIDEPHSVMIINGVGV